VSFFILEKNRFNRMNLSSGTARCQADCSARDQSGIFASGRTLWAMPLAQKTGGRDFAHPPVKSPRPFNLSVKPAKSLLIKQFNKKTNTASGTAERPFNAPKTIFSFPSFQKVTLCHTLFAPNSIVLDKAPGGRLDIAKKHTMARSLR
jgi:hypothetical protein